MVNINLKNANLLASSPMVTMERKHKGSTPNLCGQPDFPNGRNSSLRTIRPNLQNIRNSDDNKGIRLFDSDYDEDMSNENSSRVQKLLTSFKEKYPNLIINPLTTDLVSLEVPLEGKDIVYYITVLKLTMDSLDNRVNCLRERSKADAKLISDKLHGDILTVIGEGNLLICGKMKQFRQIIEQYQVEKTTKCKNALVSDLQGFWDLIYIEIKKINSDLDRLDIIKKGGYQTEFTRKRTSYSRKSKKPLKEIQKSTFKVKPAKSNFRSFLNKLRSEEKQVNAPEKSEELVRGRGRPKKLVDIKIEEDAKKSMNSDQPKQVSESEELVRGRGRPKKIVDIKIEEDAKKSINSDQSNQVSESEELVRGRGRPKKLADINIDNDKESMISDKPNQVSKSEESVRAMGRPKRLAVPKNDDQVTESVVPKVSKGCGRVRKSSTTPKRSEKRRKT